MQVWFRFVRVGLRAVLRAADAAPDAPSMLRFRVAPGDLDVNLHMNNGRYLTIMDLGRIDILVRTGMWREMRARDLTAVVAAQRVRYRLPLAPWQRFRVRTRLLGWDEDSLVFEHAVLTGHRDAGRVSATATARIALVSRQRGAERRAKAGDTLAALGMPPTGPDLPDEIREWLAFERRCDRSGRLRAVPADPLATAPPSI